MSDLTRPTAEHLADTGFCLDQVFTWLRRCYLIGDREYRDQCPEEAAKRDAALVDGSATLQAHVDVTQRTVAFVLMLDGGPPEGIPLFSQGFKPPELAN